MSHTSPHASRLEAAAIDALWRIARWRPDVPPDGDGPLARLPAALAALRDYLETWAADGAHPRTAELVEREAREIAYALACVSAMGCPPRLVVDDDDDEPDSPARLLRDPRPYVLWPQPVVTDELVASVWTAAGRPGGTTAILAARRRAVVA